MLDAVKEVLDVMLLTVAEIGWPTALILESVRLKNDVTLNGVMPFV